MHSSVSQKGFLIEHPGSAPESTARKVDLIVDLVAAPKRQTLLKSSRKIPLSWAFWLLSTRRDFVLKLSRLTKLNTEKNKSGQMWANDFKLTHYALFLCGGGLVEFFFHFYDQNDQNDQNDQLLYLASSQRSGS